jgi:hypothetical protein
MPRRTGTDFGVFLADRVQYDTNAGCWLWAGAVCPKGYGRVQWGGRRAELVHRRSYEHFSGQHPGELFVCHRCDVPACCNPDHLFLGTSQDNAADMVRKGRGARQRLSQETVLEIKARILDGLRDRAIAAEFGLIQAHVQGIRSAAKWSWLTGAQGVVPRRSRGVRSRQAPSPSLHIEGRA